MRIKYLDGLRGIAILLVLGYHAYVRWSHIMPHGDTYSEVTIFSYGWLGVQLFFLISGLVIFMTLDKTESLKSFIYKRWFRLFPAMLIAATLIYSTTEIFFERPSGQPTLYSLIPALTFIDSLFFSSLLGFEIVNLEGVFWSIFVEFKFYVIAGGIYYFFGKKYVPLVLALLFVLSILLNMLSTYFDFAFFDLAYKVSLAASLQYFGWFSAGTLFYLYFETNNNRFFLLALGMSILSSIWVKEGFQTSDITGALLVSALFASSMKFSFLQSMLQHKVLQYFGFISYPLYLIHENFMVSITIKLGKVAPWLHPFLYPLVGLFILILVAYLIAKYLEPRCRELIRFTFHKLRKNEDSIS